MCVRRRVRARVLPLEVGGWGATEYIEEKSLAFWLVKNRGIEPYNLNLLSKTVVLETDCPQLPQDKCLTHQLFIPNKSILVSPHLTCFWIPPHGSFQLAHTFKNLPTLHLTGEVHVGGQEHFYMETQRVLVIPKAEDKELDIYVSAQDPAHVQVRSRIAFTFPAS